MIRHAGHSIYWVVGTLCLAMLPQLISMPASLTVLALVPVAWRLVAERRRWKPLNLVMRVAVTAATMVVLVMTYGGWLGRRAAVSLLVLMLAVKLFETFRIRDERVVTSLCLFLCSTQFLFDQGLLMIVYGGACMTSALIAMALINRKESYAPTGRLPAGPGLAAELGFSARLLAIAAPFGLALFLFFPRWGSPLWGVPEEALDAKTGLSNSMTPGTIQSLFMDDSPAFRVRFNSAPPSQSMLYWRGPVLWEFDGLTWETSFFGRNVPADGRPEVNGAPWRYTVQLEPHEQHWLFALDYPANVPAGATLTLDYQLYSARPITQLKEYEVFSDPDYVDTPKLRSMLRAAALALPEGFNPRTLEMMRAWREETADDMTLVRRALAHFNRETFRYTLNPPLLTRHSVDEFLFETRAGFCEHYASAFTVMMRAAGIPARVVTGYQGGWYSDFGEYVLVRQSDAHAWAEVWLPELGWIRADPTAFVAPNRIEQNALDALSGRRHAFDFPWLRSVRNGFDLLERYWNNWAISFDATRQSRLFEPFGLEQLGPRGLVVVLVAICAVLGVVFAPVVMRLRKGLHQDRLSRLWSRFRRQLARAGVPITPALAPMELAAVAARQLAGRRLQIHRVAELYQRLRYARLKPDLAEFERALRAFRTAG